MHLVRFDFKHVRSKTDCNIDDEAAGEMRTTLAKEAEMRRRAEKARIRMANIQNKQRLLSIVAKTDDGDGLIGGNAPAWMTVSPAGKSRPGSPNRDELGALRDQMIAREKHRIAEENRVMKARLAKTGPTIDDDTEDDETGEARARLKKEAAAKRKAYFQSISQKNRQYASQMLSTIVPNPVFSLCATAQPAFAPAFSDVF